MFVNLVKEHIEGGFGSMWPKSSSPKESATGGTLLEVVWPWVGLATMDSYGSMVLFRVSKFVYSFFIYFFGLAENLGELMVENIILGRKKLGYTVFEFMCVQGRLNEFGGSRQKL